MSHSASSHTLNRVLTAWTLSIYGIGSILGAGIYTIIGEVAGMAGSKLWMSFGIAMGVSLLTGLSYAELGRRYPQSGAEANFAKHAFHSEWFSSLMGWLVLSASIVSMATLSHAFSGYLSDTWRAIPPWSMSIGFLMVLGVINFAGIQESSRANLVATSIEFCGLLIVLIAGFLFLTQGGMSSPEAGPPEGGDTSVSWVHILKGVSLAFFAFIGFEDIVNVAEEVKTPERNLPIGILTAATIAGVLYMAVAWVSSHIVPADQLAASDSPLLEVVKQSSLPIPHRLFTIIALFAVANTALLNSITASRILYGMSRQQLLPAWLGKIHAGRKTPMTAISIVIPIAMILAISGTLGSLAGTTSLILLIVFFCMNLSLVVIKFTHDPITHGFRIPFFIPILAGLGNLVVMIFVPRKSQLMTVAVIMAGIVVLNFSRRMSRAPGI